MKNSTKAGIAVAILVVLVIGVYTAMVVTRGSPLVVNIGYFANINHAQAILGVSSGAFQKAVGSSRTIETHPFPSGGPEMTALLAGQVDIGFVGPNPAANAFIQSNGTGLVILAGVASGGSVFVVQGDSGISSAKDLGGKTIGAPNIGNTQDVSLRYYLMSNGYTPCTPSGCGNVTIDNTSPSSDVTLFAQNKIDGAWLPEPYGDVLIKQYGGVLFKDERDLWPPLGQFSTALLVVRTQFLQQHPDVVRDIVAAEVNQTIWINAHLSQAQSDLNSSMVALAGTGYSPEVLNASFSRLTFTYDPLASTVMIQAEHAYAFGDLAKDPATHLNGLYDLSILNSVLAADGLPPVQ
jgi:NitT/TauT family transport system substrate-binding protein